MEKIRLRFHIIAIAIAGFPFLLGGMLYTINPYYVGLLILPGSRVQPFGWLVCFILLILAGLAYLGTTTFFAISSRGQNNTRMKVIPSGVVGIGVLVFVGAMVCLILFSPAMLWIWLE